MEALLFHPPPHIHTLTRTLTHLPHALLMQSMSALLEGSEAMSASMKAELLAWNELQFGMMLVRGAVAGEC